MDVIYNSRINIWNKEYINKGSNNYMQILSIVQYKGLSECFNESNSVEDNLNTFINGFKNIIKNKM